MGVVPHAAGGGDHEYGHCAHEGVDPEGEEHEDVEADERRVRVVLDGGEVVGGDGLEGGGRDQVGHGHQAPRPQGNR